MYLMLDYVIVMKKYGVENPEMYKSNEKEVSQDEPKQHTLGGNKRPWQ